MQYITGVSFMDGEMTKVDFNPLVIQLDDIDRRNLQQIIARAHEVLKKLNCKSRGQLIREKSPPALHYGIDYPQEVEYMGNYAPGFVGFLQGRQLTFWRDIFLPST